MEVHFAVKIFEAWQK